MVDLQNSVESEIVQYLHVVIDGGDSKPFDETHS